MGGILITGFTGNVGSELAAWLDDHGVAYRAAVRHPERARREHGNQLDAVAFDFSKPSTWEDAFAGIDRLFLMRPPAMSDIEREMVPALNAARAAGVKHIVFLSILGAERMFFIPHRKAEKAIMRMGFDYTFLRASFFMQNLNTTHRQEIKEDRTVFIPAGRGRTSFIDARDIAAVAGLALTEEGHRNHAYSLTGRQELSYYDVADILSEELGVKITYANPSAKQFRERKLREGMEEDMVKVVSRIYATVRLGLAKKVTPDLELLLGHPPITFREYARDYRNEWL